MKTVGGKDHLEADDVEKALGAKMDTGAIDGKTNGAGAHSETLNINWLRNQRQITQQERDNAIANLHRLDGALAMIDNMVKMVEEGALKLPGQN